MYQKKFMDIAYKESMKAFKENEVPIGAVIVKDGTVISRAHNQKEKKQCSLAHAELLAIRKASKKLNNWRLTNCEIYVTLEPCPMCASAIHQARISKIYYCVARDKNDNSTIIQNILADNNANHPVEIEVVEYDENLKNHLQDFFKKKR